MTGERAVMARMDLQSITFYLTIKHLRALEIHDESNNVLEQSTLGYPTLTKYLRKRSFPNSSESVEEEAEIGSCDSIASAILQHLNKQAFASLRQLAKRTLIPATIIQCHLVGGIG
jgi:hypothetical protein